MYKPVVGYESRYVVNIYGAVSTLPFYSPRKGSKDRFFPPRELKAGRSGAGYYTVSLYKNGKPRTIPLHRLVAEAFLLNPDAKRCVNHIDGNKENNFVNNLEWCTYSENNKHAFDIGLRVYSGRKKINKE